MTSNHRGLFGKLRQHLRHVDENPEEALDEKLLDECTVFLSTELQNQPQENIELISQISSLSPRLQQDPSPLIRLLERLVEPFSFHDVLSLQPPVDFAGGMNVEALPYNRIMLRLLKKASQSNNDLSTLASMQAVVKALINLWLSTPDVGVADEAGLTLLALLEADLERSDVAVHGIGEGARSQGGQGLLWRRVFDDKDVYSLLFSLCGPDAKRKERSLAQVRLMSIAPKIGALEWSYLTRSHQPEVENHYGPDPAKEGLLDYIAVHMTDHKDDVLLHINLLQFYRELFTLVKTPSSEK